MPRQSNTIKPITWIYISGAVFIVFVALAIVIGLFNEELSRLKPSTYFFLLIPLALMAAAFLFGALRSHAKYTGKVYGGTVELGGPVVLLALIIFLGYKFRPKDDEAFNITLNVFSNAENRSVLESGELVVNFGSSIQSKKINDGQVVLQDIPQKYRGQQIRILPKIDGFSAKEQLKVIPPASNVIDLYLDKLLDSVTVRGTVTNKRGSTVKNATLVFAEGLAQAYTDRYGNFKLTVPVKDGSETSLLVFVDDELKYNTRLSLSSQSPLSIKLP